MILFRRRRPGRHAEDGDIFTREPVAEPEDDEAALEEYVEGLARDPEPEREGGPYDVEEAPDDGVERLDLGSLKIPRLDGVEIRLQATAQGDATGVLLVAGDSAVQVGALAAPRTEGIWDDVRSDLRASIVSQGGTVEESRGRFGTELRARMRTPNGPATVRFVGVDGPRWFVQAVYQGRAAAEPDAGAVLDACLDALVVERDREARPVREPLPLRLPPEIAAQIAAQAAREAGADGGDGAVPHGRAVPRR